MHAFYLSQKQDIPNSDTRHAEIDFELFGGKRAGSGFIATNIIVGGYQFLQQVRSHQYSCVMH